MSYFVELRTKTGALLGKYDAAVNAPAPWGDHATLFHSYLECNQVIDTLMHDSRATRQWLLNHGHKVPEYYQLFSVNVDTKRVSKQVDFPIG
jgi:hypothetical protein